MEKMLARIQFYTRDNFDSEEFTVITHDLMSDGEGGHDLDGANDMIAAAQDRLYELSRQRGIKIEADSGCKIKNGGVS